MAKLFGKNKLREVAQKIDTQEISEHLEIVKKWHADYHKGSLKTDKETSREQAYNQDFFIRILGYKEKPSDPYSFEPKASTTSGQLPDAIVGYLEPVEDKGDTKVSAVVELKGASIALDKPQRREGNMSPVQQGFKYKTQYKNCPFVIVSNFYEFRLYQDNQLDYELWTLDDLLDPADDYLKFKSFYQLLRHDNFVPLNGEGRSKTEELLSDIRIEQEEIGKKFYKAYKQARLELLRDMYKNNKVVRDDINVGIEKAQKIIDRIVFACFAEDRGLLPDNTLAKVLQIDESAFGSLWDTLKGFFNAIDTGSQKLEIPDGYNGGLFATDPELNSLVISDEPLKHLAQLSRYDFEEELSVQILGHIFEQSISDLEEIKEKAEKVVEGTPEKKTSKRKKDGIFYTPDYIVRYIVENSLGTYLREAEERCKSDAGLKGDINDNNYQKREKQAYLAYQKILQNVTVCDPACGSGAFLVYVFDYLLAENQRVSAIINPEQSSLLDTDTYFKSILENNIYGVDLNSESVEITKLSLWLKSAQKGKKLTSLNSNIKCGNSLVDDVEVAGEKAFNWSTKFPSIFSNGGFDVVVGNPPYVKLQSLMSSDRNQVKFLESKYQVAEGRFDLYILFIEKALEIINSDGVASYILPHKFLGSSFGVGTRKFLSRERAVKRIVHFGSHKVFWDASTYTCIINLTNGADAIEFTEVEPTSITGSLSFDQIDYRHLGEDPWLLLGEKHRRVIDKVTNSKNRLKDMFFKISRGVVTGADSIFILNGAYSSDSNYFVGYSKELEAEVTLESKIVKPLLMGSGVSRFSSDPKDTFLVYPHEVVDKKTAPLEESALHKHYPLTYDYLSKFKDKLVKKKVKYKTNPTYWYSLHNSRDMTIFEKHKIITPYLANSTNMNIDRDKFYTNDKNTNLVFRDDDIELQNALLGILNSKLIWFFISKTGSEFSGGYFAFTNLYIESITFPEINNKKQELSRLIDTQINHATSRKQLLNNFSELMLSQYSFKTPDYWYRLEFTDFVDKIKPKLSLEEKDSLLRVFQKYKKEVLDLNKKINETDGIVNRVVYDLYNLTPEEISIVESHK